MLAERFGDNVVGLVASVTEARKELPWEERKREASEHIKHFSHDTACEICRSREQRLGHSGGFPKETMQTVLDQWPENPLANDLNTLIAALDTIELAP